MDILTYPNLVSVAAILLSIFLAVLVFLLMAGAYRRFSGKTILTCPETRRPAGIEIDRWYAVLTAPFGYPRLRVKTCSRWPENKDCWQECLDQIEATPEQLLTKWSAGKTCALCGRPVGDVSGRERFPALMDSSHRTYDWRSFPKKKLPEALATHEPVCWYCYRRRTTSPGPTEASRAGDPGNLAPPTGIAQ